MQSLQKQPQNALDLSEKQADSLAKKRARDRRAQQNQRDKRNEQVRSLQDQLTRMESKMMHLSRECELLRQENQRLREGPGGSQLVPVPSMSKGAACALELTTMQRPNNSEHNKCASAALAAAAASGRRTHREFWTQWSGGGASAVSAAMAASAGIPVSLPYNLPPLRLAQYPWSNTPAHAASDVVVTESFKNWLRRPDLVHASPEHPQPLELLYGSKTNFLADVINHSLRSWPCRDPERLAAGWLIYYLIKWMLRPSPENWARLQPFQHPVAAQLAHAHPYFVDFIHWPQLRTNMILQGTGRGTPDHNPQDVLGMFLCCTKLRWPWGENFLEPKHDGTLKLRQEFFDTFTSLDGWGLTDDFAVKFPALAQGLDIATMRYRIC